MPEFQDYERDSEDRFADAFPGRRGPVCPETQNLRLALREVLSEPTTSKQAGLYQG